jgi:DNA-binding MarR family transcriptional regulator
LSRERTEEDARANAVAITQNGRKALRSARNAADRAERALLDALPPAERTRFIKSLAAIASAAASLDGGEDAQPKRRVKHRRS